MIATDFHTALQSPDQLGSEHVTALCALTEAYPWFGSGHILLAKAMHNTGDLGYDDQLHLAAVHAGSRTVLYDLVVAKEVAEGKVEMPEREDGHAQAAELAEDTPVPNNTEAAEEVGPAKRPLDDLETNILAAGVSRVIEQEVSSGPELNEETPAAPAEYGLAGDRSVTRPSDEALSPFATWLLKRSSELGVAVDSGTISSSADHADDTQQGGSDAFEPAHPPRTQRELIDAFIANDPQITPGRLSEFDLGDLARASIVEDESLVTETMARIYAKQGKLGKARKAYEMLALKYPEKSVYFANQLKKLAKKK